MLLSLFKQKSYKLLKEVTLIKDHSISATLNPWTLSLLVEYYIWIPYVK